MLPMVSSVGRAAVALAATPAEECFASWDLTLHVSKTWDFTGGQNHYVGSGFATYVSDPGVAAVGPQ